MTVRLLIILIPSCLPSSGPLTLKKNTGAFTALVPSGASVGAYEAHELRDGDAHSYGGAGVTRAVRNVNDVIEPAILRVQVEDKGNYGLGVFNVPNPPEIGAAEGQGVLDLRTIDRFLFKLDGTEKKSNLGANAILGVSMAVARAAAAARVCRCHLFFPRFSPYSGTITIIITTNPSPAPTTLPFPARGSWSWQRTLHLPDTLLQRT